MPRQNEVTSRARPDLTRPPSEPLEAIAWALLQKPDAWDLGEWLGRLMPDGSWDQFEPEDLADAIVGAAYRTKFEEPKP
jgi:hypothetical protein